MKKKITAIVLSLVFVLSMSLGNVALADDEITVKLNGENLSFDVPPQIINGRTMVPLRTIFEALGASVAWGNSIVTSTKGDITVSITIGVPEITVNGVIKELDTAPCIIDGRTLVPARAISEAFDMSVDWYNDTKTVSITESVANINVDKYKELSKTIFLKGKYNQYGETFEIKSQVDETSFEVCLQTWMKYDFTALSVSFISEDGLVETSASIGLSHDGTFNPSLSYTIKFVDGTKYNMIGEFLYPNKPFVEKNNSIPIYLHEEAYPMLISMLLVLDYTVSGISEVTFSDLGLCYL